MSLFSDQFLNEMDPNNLPNIVLEQGRAIEQLRRQFLAIQKLSGIAKEGGEIGTAGFGATSIDANGNLLTSADLVKVNWWLPLTLAGDNATKVYKQIIRTIGGLKYLYVFGEFEQIGGVLAKNVAAYSYADRSWYEVNGGVNGAVRDAAFDSSDNLYIVGDFTDAGGVAAADYVAVTSGNTWAAVGNGVSNTMNAIAIDSSNNIYIGGSALNMGGIAAADRIALLSGGVWVAVGGGLSGTVQCMAFSNAGVLHVGGQFIDAGGDGLADYFAKLVGGLWVNVGGVALNGNVKAICFDSTDKLYIGGSFNDVGGDSNADYFVTLENGVFVSVGGIAFSDVVRALAVGPDDSIIIGGDFDDVAGNLLADSIVIWDKTQFVALSNGGGVSGLGGAVYSVAYDSATGNIFAGGDFNYAGAVQCQSLAIYVKSLSEAIDLLSSIPELYDQQYQKAWIPDNQTWTYASASTFTKRGDKTNQFRAGTRLKCVNSGAKQGYVLSSSYAAGTNLTTITVSFTVANTTISANYYSYSLYPEGYTSDTLIPGHLFITEGAIFPGFYTPTLFNITNITASTAYSCSWFRVGNVGHVSGKVDINITAAGAIELGMSLPVVSNLTGESQCGGIFAAHAVAGNIGDILADTTNDRARFRGVMANTGNRTFGFSFTFLIL